LESGLLNVSMVLQQTFIFVRVLLLPNQTIKLEARAILFYLHAQYDACLL